MRPSLWTLGLLGVLLAAASTARGAEARPVGTASWDGFEAVTLDGHRVSAESLAGRVVLLDFWATWCVPCLGEIPHLREARERFPREDLAIFGVSLDQGARREVEAFLRRHGMSWPQLWDGRGFAGDLARRFRVESLPRSFLIDREGRIVATDLRGKELLAVLEALLDT